MAVYMNNLKIYLEVQRGKIERRMHHIKAKILRNSLAMIAQTFCILIQKKQTPCHTTRKLFVMSTLIKADGSIIQPFYT